MLNNFKKTFRHSAIYSFGNLSIKAIGLVLLPLYTSHLTTDDYGALTLLEITSTIIVAVFSFKLSTSMMRWCSVEKDELQRKKIVFTTFSFSILLLLLINGVFFPFHERLSVLFFNENDFAVYFLILIASASFEILKPLMITCPPAKTIAGTRLPMVSDPPDPAIIAPAINSAPKI